LDGVPRGLNAVGDDHNEEGWKANDSDVDPERETTMFGRYGGTLDRGDDGKPTVDAEGRRGDADLESSSDLDV
jgi:hypothetical protein